MKYMTYDLLVRTQSTDEEVAEAALTEWEQACNAYNRHVDEIRPRLPKAAQTLLEGFCLHDAKFASFGLDTDREGETIGFIDLQLDSPRTQGLRLEYRLAGNIKALFHSAPRPIKAELLWLYDEFAAGETDVPAGGRELVFTHSILLSEGLELQVPFRDLGIKQYKSFLSPVRGFRAEGTADVRELLLT